MTLYLDSNVFTYSVSEEEESEEARQVLKDVEEGQEAGVTSVLTIDEVVWIVQNQADRDTAVETGRRLLGMENLDVVDVTLPISRQSLDLMDSAELDPRDGLHAATALNHGVYTVVSSDSDLDRVEKLDRRPLS